MLKYLETFFVFMKPAFTRSKTFNWFIIVIIGSILKTDNYGVSSLIRSLNLDYKFYNSLLNFFHSTAYSIKSLMNLWQLWVFKSDLSVTINKRKILIGDHTYIPKDGQKMPGVVAIHQTSETSSKPSYFRGHFWGGISLLVNISNKVLSIPLIMKIHQGLNRKKPKKKKSLKKNSLTSIILMAIDIVKNTNMKSYLILDGFFASGNSFLIAAKHKCNESSEQLLHLIIRAKKNVVAYLSLESKIKEHPRKGRPKKYGEKLNLLSLFDLRHEEFISAKVNVYGKIEDITFLCLDLIWKPFKNKIRFVLANTSRGKIILMSSDLLLEPINIIELYCYRMTIETMFSAFKNIIYGFSYHFWSKFSNKKNRIPSKKNNAYIEDSTNSKKTYQKIIAIEKFVNLHVIAIGLLQLISIQFQNLIWSNSNCWLRTFSSAIPSIFMTKIAFTNLMKNYFNIIVKNPIIDLIINKQSKFLYNNDSNNSA